MERHPTGRFRRLQTHRLSKVRISVSAFSLAACLGALDMQGAASRMQPQQYSAPADWRILLREPQRNIYPAEGQAAVQHMPPEMDEQILANSPFHLLDSPGDHIQHLESWA